MSRTTPKYLFGLALVVVSLALLTGSVLAQNTTPPPQPTGTTPPSGPSDRQEIDNFLIHRPDVAEELHRDPALINNPEWLAKHPEVQTFMKDHPNAQRVAAEHPDWATKEVGRSLERQTAPAMRQTDEFLQTHPKVAQELASNPKLIDNKEYLSQHPQLNTYLNNHPAVRNEWQAHPVTFTKAEEQYHQQQVNHNKQNPPPPHPAAKPHTSAKK